MCSVKFIQTFKDGAVSSFIKAAEIWSHWLPHSFSRIPFEFRVLRTPNLQKGLNVWVSDIGEVRPKLLYTSTRRHYHISENGCSWITFFISFLYLFFVSFLLCRLLFLYFIASRVHLWNPGGCSLYLHSSSPFLPLHPFTPFPPHPLRQPVNLLASELFF